MKTTPTTRAARHAIIGEIIADGNISSQEELRVALRQRDINVTQATLSRDLVELRATKVRMAGGRQGYVLPSSNDLPEAHMAARDHLERWCKDLLLTAQVAYHQVVVRTPPGAAQILASSIDRAVLAGVLGCVAGDDTILVITQSPEAADSVRETLMDLAEQQKDKE